MQFKEPPLKKIPWHRVGLAHGLLALATIFYQPKDLLLLMRG